MTSYEIAYIQNHSKIFSMRLYEVCKDLVTAHDAKMGKKAIEVRIEIARDILAKIEGKQQ
jgi:hypothetical protein